MIRRALVVAMLTAGMAVSGSTVVARAATVTTPTFACEIQEMCTVLGKVCPNCTVATPTATIADSKVV